ncbi:ferredoxin reductase-like protein [Basidiobolus meristosporus CBS 931.73]|uniref:NADH-cytochrome b5 reductase n=1 Tax=Basidiobolus meristosporus CBS 931.73 TaxID=1314790 RepID=A0A1Y1WXU9_9FUNG|nr:ferredoxin reductase-like protein [Basidiobolus meristosporus CBS 931.73]|eukprot:ORX77944.1 ferredoxin reductase-like protein [Basidiobolus meristosporus CBS 931.73]
MRGTTLFAAKRLVATRFTPGLVRPMSTYPPVAANARLHPMLKFTSYAVPLTAMGVAYYQYSTLVENAGSETDGVKKALDPKQFIDFKLKEVVEINYNTKRFRFELPKDTVLGMSVASCIMTQAPKSKGSEEMVVRPYTPTSDEDAPGYFDLVIKRYNGGPMSEHIHSLKPGDTLAVKGPFAKYPYKANTLKHVGMIAGGTGITPMLQVLRKIFKNPEDHTKVTLIFANVTEEDILLRKELDELGQKHKGQLDIHYTLDKPPKNWTQETGRVDKEKIQKYMPKPAKDTMVFICGPDQMLAGISGTKNPDKSQGKVGGILKELGYSEDNVYKF